MAYNNSDFNNKLFSSENNSSLPYDYSSIYHSDLLAVDYELDRARTPSPGLINSHFNIDNDCLNLQQTSEYFPNLSTEPESRQDLFHYVHSDEPSEVSGFYSNNVVPSVAASGVTNSSIDLQFSQCSLSRNDFSNDLQPSLYSSNTMNEDRDCSYNNNSISSNIFSDSNSQSTINYAPISFTNEIETNNYESMPSNESQVNQESSNGSGFYPNFNYNSSTNHTEGACGFGIPEEQGHLYPESHASLSVQDRLSFQGYESNDSSVYSETSFTKKQRKQRENLDNLTEKEKYLRMRAQNNVSSKIYRENRKKKRQTTISEVDQLTQKNQNLRRVEKQLEEQVQVLNTLMSNCELYRKF